MMYIVRVIGYNAYWTGNTEPEKLWSTNIEQSQKFKTKEEAQRIVDGGFNMEAVDCNFAFNQNAKEIPDWNKIDSELAEAAKKNIEKEQIISIDDFETSSNIVYDTEVIE